ncbi:S-adenosyl-L-methionine-dependent methyltransferase [Xylariomycetidae sp. FL2044]|nr:S-adenosyl-L-methionine-dependent methyltransferase [Xylariomycetidae sp. FL2044]
MSSAKAAEELPSEDAAQTSSQLPASPPHPSSEDKRAAETQNTSPPPADDPPAIEAQPGTATDDEDEFATSEWDESTASTASTSVTSSIYEHEYENGRRFHKYKHGRYPVPNDDIEQNREDMKHAMMMELTDGKPFYAPIGDNPQKIIDIGTGTGIWAIEVADQYPSAEVLGIDLSPIQPLWTPPNVRFIIDDVEDEWLNGSGWDLVHLRAMSAVIKDVDKLCRDAFANLRPGGWIEFQEQHAVFRCDDGTMDPAADAAVGFYRLAHEAFDKMGFDIHLAADMRAMLERAGFENVQGIVKKVPVGPWARDKTLRLIGMYNKTIIQEFIPACAGRPFQALGLSEAEREVWRASAIRSLNDPVPHRYWNIHFWFGQKPASA